MAKIEKISVERITWDVNDEIIIDSGDNICGTAWDENRNLEVTIVGGGDILVDEATLRLYCRPVGSNTIYKSAARWNDNNPGIWVLQYPSGVFRDGGDIKCVLEISNSRGTLHSRPFIRRVLPSITEGGGRESNVQVTFIDLEKIAEVAQKHENLKSEIEKTGKSVITQVRDTATQEVNRATSTINSLKDETLRAAKNEIDAGKNNAKTELNSYKNTLKQEIQTEVNNGKSAISSTSTTCKNEINSKKNEALNEIGSKKDEAISEIGRKRTEATTEIVTKKDEAVKAINAYIKSSNPTIPDNVAVKGEILPQDIKGNNDKRIYKYVRIADENSDKPYLWTEYVSSEGRNVTNYYRFAEMKFFSDMRNDINTLKNTTPPKFWKGTKQEYDRISNKDPDTVYFLVN